MIAAQALRLLPDLLSPQGSRGVLTGQYAFSTAGGTRLGFSQASAAVGIDVPTVSMEIRRRVEAFIASQSGPAATDRDVVLLSVLVLLDMMTSNDERRLVLAERDVPFVAAYCASRDLDIRFLPGCEREVPPVDAAGHTLLALGLPLKDMAEYACNPLAVKGIVIGPGSNDASNRALVAGLSNPIDEIATGVDLGAGTTVAWLWPRL